MQKQTSNAKKKAKVVFAIKNFIAILPYHILVMSGVAIISLIFNKWLEALMFLVSYFALRYKFPTTFHAKSIINCMLLTNGMFALSIILSPNINSYLFGALVFAYLDCFILWYVQTRENFKQDKECAEQAVAELTRELEQHKNPYSTLLDRCRNAKLSKRDTEIAVKYYYQKYTPKEIWLWLCETKEYETIEWDSLYQLLWRIGKKINK